MEDDYGGCDDDDANDCIDGGSDVGGGTVLEDASGAGDGDD